MKSTDPDLALNEYIEYFRKNPTDRDPSVLAALILEQVYRIRLNDTDLSWEKLGSSDCVRELIREKTEQDTICAVSAE